MCLGCWGCEGSLERCRKAKLYYSKLFEKLNAPLPKRPRDLPLELVPECVENIRALPEGASLVFSFWQGWTPQDKQVVGRLCSGCSTLKRLVIVESGRPRKLLAELRKWGFPPLRLERESLSFKVQAYGSGEEFHCSILTRRVP